MIEIRESRVSDSVDQKPLKDGSFRVGKITTYYCIWKDGRRIDRFLSRAAAEAKARALAETEGL